MRPGPTSALRYPLDRALGTVSAVRVLRVLTRHGGSLTAPDLAARCALSRPTVGKTLSDLVQLGLVEPVGPGRYSSYRVRAVHPLASAIEDLFRNEERRGGELIEQVRSEIEDARPRPTAAWLYGSFARGEDAPESDLDIAVLSSDDESRKAVEARIRDALLRVGERFDVSPSLVFLTEDELRKGLRNGKAFYRSLAEEGMQIAGTPRLLPDQDG